jgi:hypothetical protein
MKLLEPGFISGTPRPQSELETQAGEDPWLGSARCPFRRIRLVHTVMLHALARKRKATHQRDGKAIAREAIQPPH